MKALYFNVPAHGHISPSLPLVAELVRRGHAVTYFASEGYRSGIEATGATFQSYTPIGAPIDDDFFSAGNLSGAVPQRVALALMTATQASLPALLAFARHEQPDCVLFDGMCPWGWFVARILNAPAVTSLSLLPLFKPPPRMLLQPGLLRQIASVLLTDFGMGLSADKISRALSRQYGVAPLGRSEIFNAIGDLAISYTSDYFQPYASTVPKQVRFIGWSPREDGAETQADGRPLIYISLGTVNNDDAGFFRTCIDAFAGGECSVILSTGKRLSPESFGALPANVSVRDWVPQISVLKRAALFITHGGVNSVHDGLYFGVPLLVVPQQIEQTLTGMRVAELGAGVLLDRSRLSAESIRATASLLMSEPRYQTRANRVGDSLRAAGGAPRGADLIEDFVKGRVTISG
ncbi:MAG: macrolide family glycosyltransferase [Thermoflexales bacterium]